MRWLRHLFAPSVRSRFEAACMQRIQAAIAASESTHRAEVCFAVERALSLGDLLAGVTSRARSEAVFAQLRVWDTAGNNGILIYVLLAEHAIEIFADRDARLRVAADDWKRVCELVAAGFAEGRHADAIVAAIEALTPLLAAHYPQAAVGTFKAHDELPDRPNIL